MLRGRNHRSGLPKTRLEAVVDGITAFVLTVLVFDIQRPAEASWQAVFDVRGSVFTFLITAAVVATFWLGHAQQMNFITRIDRTLVWINFGGLAVVVLLPFTTAFLGSHLGERVPTALYGINVGLVGVAGLAQWRWAARREHLLRPGTPREAVRDLSWRIALALALTAVGVAIAAIWNGWAAMTFFAAAFLPFALRGLHDDHLLAEGA